MNYINPKAVIILIGLIIGYISTSGLKSQNIRLLDVFVIGPLMIYIGYLYNQVNLFSLLLVFFGATTISYNFKNYFHHRKLK